MSWTFEIRRRVPAPVKVAFKVIADVERYPEFVPGVQRVQILEEEGPRKVVFMVVKDGLFSAELISEAWLEPPHSLRIRQIKGPLLDLHQRWHLKPIPGGTEIGFQSRVTWPAFLASPLARRLTRSYANKLAQAFIQRILIACQSAEDGGEGDF